MRMLKCLVELMIVYTRQRRQRQRWRERRPISGFVTHVVMLFFASGRDISPVRVIVVAESSTTYTHTGLNLVKNEVMPQVGALVEQGIIFQFFIIF